MAGSQSSRGGLLDYAITAVVSLSMLYAAYVAYRPQIRDLLQRLSDMVFFIQHVGDHLSMFG